MVSKGNHPQMALIQISELLYIYIIHMDIYGSVPQIQLLRRGGQSREQQEAPMGGLYTPMKHGTMI